jgi:NADH dehydrogenase
MLVLVTGASGAIGQRLVRELVSRAYGVRVLSRRASQPDQPGLEHAQGDLLDAASLERAAEGTDSVFHLAAVTHTHREEHYEQVNTTGTRLLLKASAAAGVQKFLFVSSRAASEDGGAYARSKLRAEREVRSAGLPWVILRPAEVYGTGRGEAIERIIAAVKNGPVVPLIGTGNALVAPVHVQDVIYGFVEALLRVNVLGKSYTLAGPEEMTLSELITRVEESLGKRRLRLHVPVALARLAAGLASLAGSDLVVGDQIPRLFCAKSADIAPARVDLGYKPRSLEQGLDDFKQRLHGEQ